MRSLLAFLSVWGMAAGLMAAEVTYSQPEQSPPDYTVRLLGSTFAKPAEDSGTTSRHAIIADLRIERSGGKSVLMAAVDSRKSDDARPDVIRLDFTGKGNFTDAPFIGLKSETSGPKIGSSPFSASFGPEVIQVKHALEVLPVLVHGQYFKSKDFRYLSVQVVVQAQGTASFAGKTHAVRLVDCNGNFNFTDAPTPAPGGGGYAGLAMGDYLSIDVKDDGFKNALTVPCGQPVQVEGQWYKIEYAADKKQITAEPVKLPVATIKHDQPLWSCKLANKDHTLILRGGTEAIEVPAGHYSLIEYSAGEALKSKSEQGLEDSFVQVRGVNASTGKVQQIVLEEGKASPLAVGVPLQAKCISQTSGRDITFNMQLADRAGNKASVVFGPKAPRSEPRVSVIDDSGKKVYENTLEFG